MAFNLTQKPFEQMLRNVTEDRRQTAKQLSESAVKTGKDYVAEWPTRRGVLYCSFKPTGRVEITWRDRGGIKEGWYMKDWTIATTLRKWNELMNS